MQGSNENGYTAMHFNGNAYATIITFYIYLKI